jgi:hypothetical protein
MASTATLPCAAERAVTPKIAPRQREAADPGERDPALEPYDEQGAAVEQARARAHGCATREHGGAGVAAPGEQYREPGSGDHEQRDRRERERLCARQWAQFLDPAERAGPAQPAGAGDRVGDEPDQVGGREYERREPVGLPARRGELAGQRPDREEHRGARGRRRRVEQRAEGREADGRARAGRDGQRRAQRPDDQPADGESGEGLRGRPASGRAPGEQQLPAPGFLLASQQPRRRQQPPDRPDPYQQRQQAPGNESGGGVEPPRGADDRSEGGVVAERSHDVRTQCRRRVARVISDRLVENQQPE